LSDESGTIRALQDEIKKLRQYKERLNLFEETSFEAITVYDENLRCVDTNGMTTTLFHYEKDEIIGMYGLDFFDPVFRETALKSVKIRNREPYEAIMRRKDGSVFHGLIQGTTIEINGKNFRVSTCRDITELAQIRETAKQRDQEFHTIFETSPVGIFLTDHRRFIEKANLSAALILGYDSPEELIGQDIRVIHLSDESYERFGLYYRDALIRREPLKFDYQFRERDGSPVWVNVSGSAVDHSDPPDLNKGVVWCIDDISVRKAAEAELIRLSRTDPLTGIYNRGYFMDLGKREISILQRYDRPLALMMLDIDRFKRINDTYGHGVGDDAIRFVADLCRDVLRDTDILGRLGGE